MEASFYGFDLIAEYFTEHRTDILQKRASIPSVMGYQADVYANIGETKGHGVDLDLKYQKNLNKNAFLIVRGNLTYAHSEYLKYEDNKMCIRDRFYQTDNASSSSSFTLGTGIGLALAKGIMNMHHGKIEVESTVGEGTKFILSLPLGNRHFSDEEMAVTEGRESLIIPEASVSSYGQLMAEEIKEPESQKNMDEEDKPTILLVDDNTELLSMLEDIFLPMYNVYTACNGREGLELSLIHIFNCKFMNRKSTRFI